MPISEGRAGVRYIVADMAESNLHIGRVDAAHRGSRSPLLPHLENRWPPSDPERLPRASTGERGVTPCCGDCLDHRGVRPMRGLMPGDVRGPVMLRAARAVRT